jgi:hypothetical protein
MAELSGDDWFLASRRDTMSKYYGGIMSGLTSANTRRGITVLALLLLIIALVVGGFFLVRYLTSSTS